MVRTTTVLSRTNYRLCKRNIAEKVACAINKNSPNVVNDLMTNLKIGTRNSVNSIGFRLPIDVPLKHSGQSRDSVLSNIIVGHDSLLATTTQLDKIL